MNGGWGLAPSNIDELECPIINEFLFFQGGHYFYFIKVFHGPRINCGDMSISRERGY